MPSRSLQDWQSDRSVALDEIEQAHRSVGGSGPGRRYATQQINRAYAVLLAAQFQGFCRALHSECATLIVHGITPTSLQLPLRDVLVKNRKLDRGNADPGSIGDDFNRFGLTFWHEVRNLDSRNATRQAHVTELNKWRNAIAHHDFDPAILGRLVLQLRRVRTWRTDCEQLAITFDEVMRRHLVSLMGISPW